MKLTRLPLTLLFFILFLNCEPKSAHNSNRLEGSEGNACYPNNTCDENLVCNVEGFCVVGQICTNDEHCNDKNICTDDKCNRRGICEFVNNQANCDDGLYCNGIDTCKAGTCQVHTGNPCFEGVKCTKSTNSSKGYICDECPVGYEGDGEKCTDIDGCANQPCFPDVDCTDIKAPGISFECASCPSGYEGDGITCQDVDECDLGIADCQAEKLCVNRIGSYVCVYKKTKIDAADSSICSLNEDGSISCWGSHTDNVSSSIFVDLTVSDCFTCGLREDMKVSCWGRYCNTSFANPTPDTAYMTLTSDKDRICGLRTDGTIYCWGHCTSGDYSCGECRVPSSVQDTEFLDIAAGHDSLSCLRDNGSIIAWGCYDELIESEDGIKFTNVDMRNNVCGLTENGKIICYGDNTYGQRDVPESEQDTTFIDLSVGLRFTCGIRETGSIVCWGNNDDGQTNVPESESSTSFIDVAAGRNFVCGIRKNGSVVCWGNNDYGQCEPNY